MSLILAVDSPTKFVAAHFVAHSRASSNGPIMPPQNFGRFDNLRYLRTIIADDQATSLQ
jgi:hypothetical protein